MRGTGNDLWHQQPLTLISAEKKIPAAKYPRKLISSPPDVAGSCSAETEFRAVVRCFGHIYACKHDSHLSISELSPKGCGFALYN